MATRDYEYEAWLDTVGAPVRTIIDADSIIEANPMCALLALTAYRAGKEHGAAAGLAELAQVEHNYGRTMRAAVESVVTDIAANPAAWKVEG